MDLSRFRRHFPAAGSVLFLNHASESPLCTPVRERINAYLDIAELDPDAAPVEMDRLKGELARLLGGRAEEYAALPNTATGLGIVAGGYPWEAGDNVVVPAQEYPANVYPWLSLRERGVEVRTVLLDDRLRVDPARVASLVDDRTRVLAVSAVEYLSGFRNDLKALSQIAHAHGALFVVDGIQGAGAVPINVEDEGIDVLAAGGYKWLLGPVGTGFAYYRRSAWDRIKPLLPGSRSSVKGPEDSGAEFQLLSTAQRYETGCLPFSLIHGWTGGLELLSEAGIPQIHAQILSLTDCLIEGLARRGYRVVSSVERQEERSGIVAFSAESLQANQALVKRLAARRVIIALRGGFCRVSPHFYNTLDEMDQFLTALGEE